MEQTDIEREQMQICEIAFITGSMYAFKIIQIYQYDMLELYEFVYKPILLEYNECLANNNFIHEEEYGYIFAFAQRRLRELYGTNN